MQPRQMRETFMPVRPRFTYSMSGPQDSWICDRNWMRSGDWRTRRLGENLLVDIERIGVEADELHHLDAAFVDVVTHRVHGDSGGSLGRKTVDTGADRRERD